MILITYGTRPEWLKVKPVIAELEKRNLPHKVLFTGQHQDIAPKDADYVFEMNYVINNNRLDTVIGNILKQTDILDDKQITHVLVQGDTTSVLALALSAFNHGKKVIHLEAGLRTYDFKNPYPEEANRQLVSRITDLHLSPTTRSQDNLHIENIHNNIHVVGNTALDNLLDYKDKCEYGLKVLVTLHRRENHAILDKWFMELNKLAINNNHYEFILPLHPNPNVQKHKNILTRVNVIDPLPHTDLLEILVKSRMVITDSGGIQEESSFFNKKCLVCRETTERPEAIGMSSFLVKSPQELPILFNNHINLYEIDFESPFGDGYAAKKVVDVFEEKVYV
jgi:UDP-N-acetylglucosamine 2-epimerase